MIGYATTTQSGQISEPFSWLEAPVLLVEISACRGIAAGVRSRGMGVGALCLLFCWSQSSLARDPGRPAMVTSADAMLCRAVLCCAVMQGESHGERVFGVTSEVDVKGRCSGVPDVGKMQQVDARFVMEEQGG